MNFAFSQFFESYFNQTNKKKMSLKKIGPSEEKIEFTKGNYKTTLTLHFDSYGRLHDVTGNSELFHSPEELKEKELRSKLQEAIDKEDYIEAHKIKQELESL